jgi:hypothetical protein
MSYANGPRIVTDGLVLHLDAGNRKSYSGSGTTWTDLSGNGNNGTLVNGVGYSSDNKGSMVFDNVNDYVDITSFSATTINNSTIIAWIKDTSADTNYRAIVQHNLATDDALYIYPSTGNNVLGWWPAQASNLPVQKNEWTFVAASHTYGSGILYQVNNNYFWRSGTYADPTDWDFIRIGAHGGGDGERWGGNIAQVSIYNRALIQQEIQQNYNALKGRFGL